jgi:hypothetical protein
MRCTSTKLHVICNTYFLPEAKQDMQEMQDNRTTGKSKSNKKKSRILPPGVG